MSIGPCLCGDPYCPSCGDPGAVAREDWIDHLDTITADFDDLEAGIFERVGMKAVEEFRAAQKEIQARMTGDY
jgi:hypothetical protein